MIVEHAVIAIPARNEEDTIAACLRSVQIACRRVPISTTIVVVLDDCTDRTARIAERFRGVTCLVRDYRNVGRARDDGVRAALRMHPTDPDRTWIAFTDADSVVPPGWLREHLDAAIGADAYVGAVVPVLGELDEPRQAAWHRTHPPGATLGHVHGANLGVSAAAYLTVGGVQPFTLAEDVDFVARLRVHGYRIAESDALPVSTSARIQGRAHGGYAQYLRDLA